MRPLWILLIPVIMGSCQPSGTRPLIIGHRGAMGHVTENTTASVEKALEIGVDMIEIDVFRIRSGEIIVFHDDRVDRLTDGSGPVEAFDFEGLFALNLEGGHKIPTLEQILQVMQHRVPLNIELKGAGTATGVHAIVREYCRTGGWQPDQFVISSFDWDELRAYRGLDAGARIAVLTDENPLEAIDTARELGAEAINPANRQMDKATAAALHDAGFQINVWTVNSRSRFDSLQRMGVDGVFTNYPDRMH